MTGVIERKRRNSRFPILNKLSDFANVFKAFIGSNYLTLPFAFKQSGLILGIIGLILIAYITDHCCVMIVKCKKAAIDKIMKSTYYCPIDGENDEYRRLEKRKMKLRRNLELAITYGDVGQIAMGQWGSRIVNAALIITQFSFCVNYFIFMGDTITRMFPVAGKNQTSTSSPNSSEPLRSSAADKHQGAPAIIYLMMIPFPIFLLQTYIRNIRSLGPLSGIANACVFLGFFSILGFILKGIDFSNVSSDKIDFWKFSTFPIFFGQLVGAYEGIGTIIPIEASMNENRANFKKYLHGAILLVSIILGTFGIFGYIHFTDNVEQLISDNLPYGTLSIIVEITLCVGILFTYPLQVFPIVQIAENFFFKETQERSTLTTSFSSHYSTLRGETPTHQYQNIPQVDESFEDESSDDECIMYGEHSGEGQNSAEVNGSEEEIGLHPVTGLFMRFWRAGGLCSCDMSWSTWKRNILRTIIVCMSFGVAYAARNYYAYIAALSGSIGSSLLAFILPCIFHLIIKRDVLPTYIVAKDILLVLFGIIAGLVGFVTTLIKIIK